MNKTYFFQADIKSVEEDKGSVIIEGYASTPDLDRYRDIVDPKAFKDALDLFMKNPVMLRSHNPDKPIGVWLSATVSSKGLKVRGEVKDEQTMQEVLDGRMRALSIGYIPLESTLQHEDGTPFNTEVDSLWDSNLVKKITKLDLIEISIVSTPANGYALFTLGKSLKHYFNETVIKSFMKNKEMNQEEPGKAIEEAPVTPAAPPAEETKSDTEPDKAKEEVGSEAGKPAAEGDNKEANAQDSAAPAGEKPAEDPEKPGETPGADGGEGGEKPAEEPKADGATEPAAADGAAKDSEEAIPVNEETAKMFPEFIQAGIMVEAKDAKDATDVPAKVAGLLVELKNALVAQTERANEAEEKLKSIPEKRALTPQGQFDAMPDEKKEAEKPAGNAFGAFFKTLVDSAK